MNAVLPFLAVNTIFDFLQGAIVGSIKGLGLQAKGAFYCIIS